MLFSFRNTNVFVGLNLSNFFPCITFCQCCTRFCGFYLLLISTNVDAIISGAYLYPNISELLWKYNCILGDFLNVCSLLWKKRLGGCMREDRCRFYGDY